ncbi:MAG: CmcI family methyltransferase [Bryobacteraceae bacterium]
MTLKIIAALLSVIGFSGCRRAAHPVAAEAPPCTEVSFWDPTSQARVVGEVERASGITWAQRLFAVRLDRPSPLPSAPLYVTLDFSVPEEIGIGTLVEDVTLTARVNGLPACRETYRTAGRRRLSCPVPVAALEQPVLVVEYECDRSFRDWATGAQYALALASVRLEPYEATEAFHALQVKRAHRAEEEVIREWEKYPPGRRRRMQQLMAGLPAWNNTRYLGVRAGRNPVDLWMAQQLIYEIRPEFVVATGVGEGGAALYYAHALGGQGKVIAAGEGEVPRAAAEVPLWKNGVEFISGAPAARPVVEKVAARVAGGKTLVILGSGGAGRDAAAELNAYAPLVSPGSCLVVEEAGRNSAVAAAVQAFLAGAGGRDFEPDRRREAFLIGFHNGGWLRRK